MAVGTNQMRKFLNDPAAVVKESLAGLAAAHSDLLRYDVANQIIVRKDAPKKGKVSTRSSRPRVPRWGSPSYPSPCGCSSIPRGRHPE